MDIDKLYPAIKEYIAAVEHLTKRLCIATNIVPSISNLGVTLTMYFNDGGKALQVLLPDNEEEIGWKTQRLEAVVKDIVANGRYIPMTKTVLDTGLSTVSTGTAQPEPGWVELETMKELV